MTDTTSIIIAVLTALPSVLVFVRQSKQAENIQKIEVATNSMKDALVKATGEAAHAKGVIDEKARAKSEPYSM